MSEVVFVGTSDAFGAAGRRQSAILLRSPEGSVLLDCGPTTVTGLSALGLVRDEIDSVLVSHFHGDHFGGIPQLLLACRYADRRSRPLTIAGPVGVEKRVRDLARLLGYPLERHEGTFPLEFQELQAGKLDRVGPAQVSSFETHHQKEVQPHGLTVQTGSHRVVFSGDTGWFDGLPAHAAGADLFICECTNLDPGFEYHLSLGELRERLGEFDCGRLVLTHLGQDMAPERGRCEIETADDGLILHL
ncbi:MAG: MBL fold metallo-hydrolase [Myxococcota bacterium]